MNTNIQSDTPQSVRIRTDDGNEWRYDALEKGAEFYQVNRSDAAAFACNDLAEIVGSARRVLEREDLTVKQRREIAEQLSTRAVQFDVQEDLEVVTKGEMD